MLALRTGGLVAGCRCDRPSESMSPSVNWRRSRLSTAHRKTGQSNRRAAAGRNSIPPRAMCGGPLTRLGTGFSTEASVRAGFLALQQMARRDVLVWEQITARHVIPEPDIIL